jgi:diacylglycerol kinase (ATP)
MKWCILINPFAGKGNTIVRTQKIKQALDKAGLNYSAVETQSIEKAKQTVQAALEEGVRAFAVAGGDGSIHLLVNILMEQTTVPPSTLTVGIIPVGTGNDWIRTHNIPKNYTKAIQLLKHNKTTKHDIGAIQYIDAQDKKQQRYFINIAGLAYDAYVTLASTRAKSKSQLEYIKLILGCAFSFKPRPMQIQADQQVRSYPFFNVTIGICKFNGGGTKLVPHAQYDSGKFALTLFKDIKSWEVIVKAPSFYTGGITKHKEAEKRTASSIQIEAINPKKPVYIEADGEYLGKSPIHISMLHKAINVVVP